jgi:predicted ester cyclase
VLNKKGVIMSNKILVKTFCQRLWEHRELGAIDEFFLSDSKIYSPFNVKFGSLTMREIAEKWLTAFPDLLLTWQDFIADDDKVMVRWQAEGTHMGSFFETKPTNHEVIYNGVNIFTLNEGKVSSYWSLVDIHSILKQIEMESINEALD